MRVKLLMLLGGRENTPSTRQRVYEIGEQLKDCGIAPTIFAPWAPDGRKRALGKLVNTTRLATELLRHDVVFMQRTFLPQRTVDTIRALNPRIIYSIDDAWFTSPDLTEGETPEVLERRARLNHVIHASARVLVPNEYLASYVAKHNPAVSVWPVPVDCRRFVPRAHKDHPRPVIGWHGAGDQYYPYLRFLKAVFDELATDSEFTFRLIGAQGSRRVYDLFAGAGYAELIDWIAAYDEMPAAVADLDIGVVPLFTDAWSRGKFPLKALEYMAAGVPMVCAPVGIDLNVLKDGENAMLATSQEEWAAKLRRLLQDADLRQRVGSAARLTAERHYSFEVVANQFANHVRDVVALPRWPRAAARRAQEPEGGGTA